MTTVKKTRAKRRQKTDFEKQLDKCRGMQNINTIEIELESFGDFIETRKSKQGYIYSTDRAISEPIKVSEEMRQMTNTLKGYILKNYNQMIRTKIYRKYTKEYRKLSEQISKLDGKKKLSKDEEELLKSLTKSKKKVGLQLEDLKTEYRVAVTFLKEKESELRANVFKRIDSVLGLKCVDRVWLSLEKVMFGDADKLNFKKKGELPSLEGKQSTRCIILKTDKADNFFLKYGEFKYRLKVKDNDLYTQETLYNIKNYMQNGAEIDKANVELFVQEKPLISTYRVIYNRITFKKIRGRIRLYLQIVYEGNAVPRRKKDGSMRHTYGKGRVANDVGTQSVAAVSKDKVVLKNLAERSNKTLKFEAIIRMINRAMDRSRRANNPDFYNEDGTIKKGASRPKDKQWKESNNYKKLRFIRKEMYRKSAESREYAVNEDVNDLRRLGDEAIVEQMSIKSLQKRAKETSINAKTGKINRKKRYGKSIGNRCPGYFISQLKRRFESTGGKFFEVNTWTFKASQFDHKLNDCNKKQLSQRWHRFSDGERVQRDLYSAMLLYCSDTTYSTPEVSQCIKFYPKFFKMHNECINNIKMNKIKVLNSGIK